MNELGSDSGSEHTFNWDNLRQRIVEVEDALVKIDEITPEALEQLWASRAAKLARAPLSEDTGEQINLVLIRLGREIFGLHTQCVRDIQAVKQITPVPRVPEWVVGVVNLRGRICSVVDLQRFFNLPGAESNLDNNLPQSRGIQGNTAVAPYLVVVETPDMELALLVNEVLSIESVPADGLQDATDTVRGLRSEYVLGVADYQSDNWWDATTHIVVLDLPAVLADEQLIIHEVL